MQSIKSMQCSVPAAMPAGSGSVPCRSPVLQVQGRPTARVRRSSSVSAPCRLVSSWRCRATPQRDQQYDYSDPVNAFLGRFLPSNKAAKDELAHIDFSAPKLKGLSPEQMRDLLEEGLTRSSWFVTGDVDPRLFSDSFAFKDESVATTGIKAYATGVRKLFDQATSKAELIAVEVQQQQQQQQQEGSSSSSSRPKLVVTWRLEGGVNLPFKPRIKPYVVTTTFTTDAEGLIDSQLDEFSVPGWDLMLSTLLGPGFGAPPAPDAATLRQQYQQQRQRQAAETRVSQ